MDLSLNSSNSSNEDDRVQIKELPLDQWHLLEGAFVKMDSSMPNPSNSAILVAIEDDKILGFVVMQSIMHVEPLFVYPEGQHRKIWEKLYNYVDELLPNNFYYFITTEQPAIEKLAKDRGFMHVGKALAQLIDRE